MVSENDRKHKDEGPITAEELHSGYLLFSHSSTPDAHGSRVVQSWQTAVELSDGSADQTPRLLGAVRWLLVDTASGANYALPDLDGIGGAEGSLGSALVDVVEDADDARFEFAVAAMLVTDVWTVPDVRGSGLGRLLVQEVTRAAAFSRDDMPVLLLSEPAATDSLSDQGHSVEHDRPGEAWLALGLTPVERHSPVLLAPASTIVGADIRPYVAPWVAAAYPEPFGRLD